MSASDPAHSSPSPAASGEMSAGSGARPPRSGRSLAGLALVLALLALIAVAFGGWRLWQLERGGHADTQSLHDVQEQVQALQSRVDTLVGQRQSLQDQVQQAAQQSQGLQSQVQGLSERSRSLENAVASLTARAQSGHDAMRLDEAETLLRMADERFSLFHDGASAIQAYGLAERAMSEVEDPAYAGVRQSIERERQALQATNPGQRQNDLDTLARLRGEVANWPLKPQEQPSRPTGTGFWQRVRRAFSGLVRITRSSDEVAAQRHDLARSLTALDLAQAQAALLDWNDDGFRAALEHADARIERNFDTSSQKVQNARAQIHEWLTRPAASAPELGDALRELRNVRAVHAAAQPADAPSEPKAKSRGKGTRR